MIPSPLEPVTPQALEPSEAHRQEPVVAGTDDSFEAHLQTSEATSAKGKGNAKTEKPRDAEEHESDDQVIAPDKEPNDSEHRKPAELDDIDDIASKQRDDAVDAVPREDQEDEYTAAVPVTVHVRGPVHDTPAEPVEILSEEVRTSPQPELTEKAKTSAKVETAAEPSGIDPEVIGATLAGNEGTEKDAAEGEAALTDETPEGEPATPAESPTSVATEHESSDAESPDAESSDAEDKPQERNADEKRANTAKHASAKLSFPESASAATTEAVPPIDDVSTHQDVQDSPTEVTGPRPDNGGQNAAPQERLAQHLVPRAAEPAGKNPQLNAAEQTRFVERVARAFQAAEHRGGAVKLRLHPPELGALQLEIKVQRGTLTARLEAETTSARSLLLENLPMLRERLGEQGVRLEQFDVDLTDRQPRNSDGHARERAEQHHHHPPGSRSSARTESSDTQRPTETVTTPGGDQQLDITI